MTLICTRRAAYERDGKTHLLVMLGGTYAQWLREWLHRDRAIAFYLFMRVFEQSQISGESGAHRRVCELEVSPKPITLPITGETAYAVAATLDCELNVYKRLRRIGPKGREDTFPRFTVLAGGDE